MRRIRKKAKKTLDPIIVMLLLIVFIALISVVFSLVGINGSVTYISNNTLESSLITVRNIFSPNGIKSFFSKIMLSYSSFMMFINLIVILFGFGVCENSGLFEAMFSKFKKVKFPIITFFVLILSVFAGLLGEVSYVVMIPFTAIMYKYLNRNPMVGVLTAFIGLSAGYGVNFAYNYDDISLGLLTQTAAQLDVDKNYTFKLLSNIYIMIISGLLISFIGTFIIEKFLVSKFKRRFKIEETVESKIYSKKALMLTRIVFILMILIVTYTIIPGLPGSGILLSYSSDTYVEKLWSNSSPFSNGLVFIISLIMVICGSIYGFVSGNFKSSEDLSNSFNHQYKDLGKMFVLFFITAQLLEIINYTRIDSVVAGRLTDFVSSLQFSGILLILTVFIVILIVGILIPNTMTKWKLLSPVMVPLFMRSNITPEFTQFLFRVTDGISKLISPVFGGFIVMLVFAEKYNQENEKFGLTGLLKKMNSTIVLFIILWLLIITGWYIVGLPLGYGINSTL